MIKHPFYILQISDKTFDEISSCGAREAESDARFSSILFASFSLLLVVIITIFVGRPGRISDTARPGAAGQELRPDNLPHFSYLFYTSGLRQSGRGRSTSAQIECIANWSVNLVFVAKATLAIAGHGHTLQYHHFDVISA